MNIDHAVLFVEDSATISISCRNSRSEDSEISYLNPKEYAAFLTSRKKDKVAIIADKTFQVTGPDFKFTIDLEPGTHGLVWDADKVEISKINNMAT